MDKYYESMIRDIKKDYDIEDDSPLAELIITFQYLLEEYEKQEKVKMENEELKKRLEEKEEIACNWKDSCLENAGKIEKTENQQQEFIKYLKSINSFETIGNILSKYKEIIGADTNVGSEGE